MTFSKLITSPSEKALKKLDENSIDLIITSPPYDAIRTYKGFSLDYKKINEGAFRVLKDGGIYAVVIQDQTKDFAKSMTTFRWAIDAVDNAGFKLYETLIYKKNGTPGPWWKYRFRIDHEYILVFLKGKRPKTFNKDKIMIPSKHGGKTMIGSAQRLTNGKVLKAKKVHIKKQKDRGTIWEYMSGGDGTKQKHLHPATYPDLLPVDFIRVFTDEGDTVLDPFSGSATTGVAAKTLKRNYIGIDISKEYNALGRKRIKEDTEFLAEKIKEYDKARKAK